jgi:hypothetical protein
MQRGFKFGGTGKRRCPIRSTTHGAIRTPRGAQSAFETDWTVPSAGHACRAAPLAFG